MKHIIFIALVAFLGGCSKQDSTNFAKEIIKQCNGLASIEVSIGSLNDHVVAKCQWQKQAAQ